jgi:hypothetical protein
MKKAGLAESAIREHAQSHTGHFVNYNQLPDKLWDSVLPDYFGIKVNPAMKKNVQEVSGVYSKGRGVDDKGPRANRKWEDDSTKKHSTASQQVTDAVHTFMDETYEQLEELSKEK